MPTDPKVDAWFDDYDNPMKPAVQRVREIILDLDALEAVDLLSAGTCGFNSPTAPWRNAQDASASSHDRSREGGHRGAPPNPISLPSGSWYVTLRTPFPYVSRTVGSSPRAAISVMSALRSSTKIVCMA